MATLEQVESAFLKADAAGDTESASVLANEVRRLRSEQAMQQQPSSAKEALASLDKINRVVAPSPEQPSKPYSFDPLKRIYGAADAATALLSGIQASVIGNVAGAAGGLYSKATGGPDISEDVRRDVTEAMTYSPRSDYGRATLGDVGNLMNTQVGKMVQGLPIAGQELQTLARATKQIRPAMEMRGAEKALKASDEGWANSAQIDAAQTAQKLGLTVPSSTIVERAIGKDTMSKAIAKVNAPKVQELAKRDMGMPTNRPPTKESFNTALEKAGEVRNVIKQIPSVVDDGTTATQLRTLIPDELIDNASEVRKISASVSRAEKWIADGMSGSQILDNISDMRKKASAVYKADNPGPAKMAKADAQMGIANALEEMLDRHLSSDPSQSATLAAFRNSRAEQAKIYMYKNAFDQNLQSFDPMKIARLTAKDNAITGIAADLGKVAGVFPESVGVKPTVAESFMAKHASRFGLSGLIGGAVGLPFGVPMQAALAAGAGAEVLAPFAARKIAESGRRSTLANDPRLGKFGSSIRQTPEELSLAPLGASIMPTAQSSVAPQIRGLLGIADEAQPGGGGLQMPVMDFNINRPKPIGRNFVGPLAKGERPPSSLWSPMERELLAPDMASPYQQGILNELRHLIGDDLPPVYAPLDIVGDPLAPLIDTYRSALQSGKPTKFKIEKTKRRGLLD